MKKEFKNNIQRRSFFKRLSFGLTGTAILSSIPYKVFAKTNKARKKIKVNIHSSAVKRNK